ncbi:hypothetical protein [Pantoea sp. A4]|jgi:hypothetical protein|uniref:hypothetical protein n=1 Tax=Pantoea sp. A4 TaxID=1225184 RepID=UPI0003645FCA|nr:hypothetical protein [Pantoea sp. A4]
MQALILALLLLIAVLLGSALWLWRRRGWRNRKHQIVFLIVLAAALQLVNIKLLTTGL